MKTWLKSNRGFILFLLCFGLFRSAIADWNPIPSGSMRPNLLEGDVVLVNRIAYDLKLPLTDRILQQTGEPKRGDVVVFFSPLDHTRLIKRLIALPGDVVEMKEEVLYINGKAADYENGEILSEPHANGQSVQALRVTEKIGDHERRVQMLQNVSTMRSFGPLQVPPGQYLMLGDNRDNSADSRYFGFVPRQLLVGRAHHVVVSADILGNWMPRFERFWHPL